MMDEQLMQIAKRMSEQRHRMIESFLMEKFTELGVAPETLASTHQLVFTGDDFIFSETSIQINPNWELLTNEEFAARYGSPLLINDQQAHRHIRFMPPARFR